jgi:putative flippase GtrA
MNMNPVSRARTIVDPLAGRVPAGGSGMPAKFGRFLLVGGFCTAIQYVLLILLKQTLLLPATAASTVGYLVSALMNYALSHSFTFRSSAPHDRALPRFLLVGVVGLALNAAVVFIGTELIGVHYMIAQLAATAATLLWNFCANLLWTF